MTKIKSLQSQLASLEAEIRRIQDQGDVLEGARLELVAPGGTAGVGAKGNPRYGRLRWGRGAERVSRYVPLDEIAGTQAAIERGRQVAGLRREVKAITKKINVLTARIAALSV